MILGVHHTAIATSNIDELSQFYCELFGLTKLGEDQWSDAPELDRIVGIVGSAARFMLLSAGNQIIELFEFRSPIGALGDPDRPVCDCGITHICFGVQDIDAEYERLSAAGMRFHAAPARAGSRPVRAAYGRDPDGNVIEILELLGESAFDYLPTKVAWRPHTTPV